MITHGEPSCLRHLGGFAAALLCMPLAFTNLSAADKIIERSGETKYIKTEADGTLKYIPNQHGDVIVDFSHCGYGGGGVAIPDVPVVTTLSPSGGDDGAAIQRAIDELAKRPLGADGFRGAILLKAGTYRVGQELFIRDSGIVLRGEGPEQDGGTILLGTMRWQKPKTSLKELQDSGMDRKEARQMLKNNMALLTIGGEGGMILDEAGASKVTNDRVAVGAREFDVESGHNFTVGDHVMIIREGNRDWIRTIRMDQIKDADQKGVRHSSWGPYQHRMDRVITAVNGKTLTIDVPLPIHIDQRWGGAEVIPYSFPSRVSHSGVERIRFDVEFDRSVVKEHDGEKYFADTNGCKQAVVMVNAEHGWARNIVSANLQKGFNIEDGTKFITLQDCVVVELTGVIEPGSRSCYHIQGSMLLLNRCYAETGRHNFNVGSRVEGPNVFLDCVASKEYSDSEPHHRYSVAGLFDNVQAQMKCQDRQSMGSGHGYQGANYVFWNTHGRVTINSPETAENYCIGHVGARGLGTFVYQAIEWREKNPGKPWPTWTRIPQGYWESHGQHVSPRSLYLAQLEDRLGADAVRAVATAAQISGEPVFEVLDYAEEVGASYTEMARDYARDTRSWVRLQDRKQDFEDAKIRTEGGELLKSDIPNHFE